MMKKMKKDKPKTITIKPKRGRPKQTAAPKRARHEEEEEPKESEIEEEEQEEEEDEDDEDEEDEMADETQNPSETNEQTNRDTSKYTRGSVRGQDHVGKPGGGDEESGPGDDEEKLYVVGYGNTSAGMKHARLYGEYYPREEVWQILLDEAHAQEVYETESYDARIVAMQELRDKVDEVFVGTYDPDKIRESAKKLNEQRTDPEQVKQQAEKVQQLRKKLYPQPHTGGGGGGSKGGSGEGRFYPGSMTGGAGQSMPSDVRRHEGGVATFSQPR